MSIMTKFDEDVRNCCKSKRNLSRKNNLFFLKKRNYCFLKFYKILKNKMI